MLNFLSSIFAIALLAEVEGQLKTIENSPACNCSNVTYEASKKEGIFFSPNYPLSYCPGINCNWTILAGDSDTGIRVKFDRFKVDKKRDALIVYYIENGKYIPVEKYTGDWGALRDFVTAPGQGLHFDFRSGASKGYPGFLLEFSRFKVNKTNCGCNKLYYKASSTEAEVTSPSYPEEYCHNLRCYYVLSSESPTHGVELKFDKVDLENKKDAVYIYDLYDVFDLVEARERHDKRFLAWLHGSNGEKRTYKSKGTDLLLIFVSDSDQGNSGFHATYKTFENKCICPKSDFSDDKGTFSSPGFPDFRCKDMTCTYRFKALGINKVPRLNFTSFDISTTDRLQLVDNKDNDKVFKVWWKDQPLETFTADSNEIVLKFVSKTPTLGFQATYEMVQRPKGCTCQQSDPVVVNERTRGWVTAPGFPDDYCGPLDCFYELRKPSPKMTRLDLEITVDTASSSDFIEIATSPLNSSDKAADRRQFYGSEKQSKVELDNVDQLAIQFHTEEPAKGHKGFNITYLWKEKCSCGKTDLGASKLEQTLTSPFYPKNYCNSVSCTWQITGPQGSRIVFKLVEFDTEHEGDFLTIFDGTTTSSKIYIISGRTPANQIVRSSHHLMRIDFSSNVAKTGKGFKGVYSYEAWRDIHGPSDKNDTTHSSALSGKLTELIQKIDKIDLRPGSIVVSSGWQVAGPIFLSIVLLIIGFSAYIIYRKICPDRICFSWPWKPFSSDKESESDESSFGNPNHTASNNRFNDPNSEL